MTSLSLPLVAPLSFVIQYNLFLFFSLASICFFCSTVMSASCATDEVMRGIIHGAVDYLLKPVRIEAGAFGEHAFDRC
jgi:hypothetical protein